MINEALSEKRGGTRIDGFIDPAAGDPVRCYFRQRCSKEVIAASSTVVAWALFLRAFSVAWMRDAAGQKTETGL